MNICKLKKAVAYTLVGLCAAALIALMAIEGYNRNGIIGAVGAVVYIVAGPAILTWAIVTIIQGCK